MRLGFLLLSLLAAAHSEGLAISQAYCNVPPDLSADPVLVDDEVNRFARSAVGDAVSPEAKAERLFAALLDLRQRGVLIADRDNRAKPRWPQSASALLRSARDVPSEATAERRMVGCLELTLLFLATARAAGLAAFAVEPATPAPAPGTDVTEHVMAAVSLPERDRVFDLQNQQRPEPGTTRALSDEVLRALFCNQLAVAATLRGQPHLARRAIEAALSFAPTRPSLVNNRAVLLANAGELDAALADAWFAVRLAPTAALYRLALGKVLLQRGDRAAALGAFAEAVRLDPTLAPHVPASHD
jgi:tetratricopeptide (TPR) repeat protein